MLLLTYYGVIINEHCYLPYTLKFLRKLNNKQDPYCGSTVILKKKTTSIRRTSVNIEIRAAFATRRGRNYFDRFHTEIEIVAEQ